MKNLDNLVCGNFLPELILSQLGDLCWKILQEPIFLVNSRSYHNGHTNTP